MSASQTTGVAAPQPNDKVLFRCSLPAEATHFEGMSLVSVTRRDDLRGKEPGAWN